MCRPLEELAAIQSESTESVHSFREEAQERMHRYLASGDQSKTFPDAHKELNEIIALALCALLDETKRGGAFNRPARGDWRG